MRSVIHLNVREPKKSKKIIYIFYKVKKMIIFSEKEKNQRIERHLCFSQRLESVNLKFTDTELMKLL